MFNKNEVAFLIEGYKSGTRFDEVRMAIMLAKANAAPIFDTIESYSPAHLANILETIPDTLWPLCIALWLNDFHRKASVNKIINKIITPGFIKLIENKIITKLPRWFVVFKRMSNLIPNFTIDNAVDILNDILPPDYTNSAQQFKLFASDTHKIQNQLSDKLSRESLLHYLKITPNIKCIFALVGELHVAFCDSIKDIKIIKKQDNMRKLCVNLENRIVIINIFGGTHGKTDHFEAMQVAAKNYGLIIPETAKTSITTVCEQDHKIDDQTYQIVQELLLFNFNRRNDTFPSQQRKTSVYTETSDRSSRTPIIFDLEKCVEKFTYWKENCTHPDNITDGESLLRWLYCDSEVKMVNQYEDFCELAKKLNKGKYNISILPSEDNFKQALDEDQTRDKKFEAYQNYEKNNPDNCKMM